MSECQGVRQRGVIVALRGETALVRFEKNGACARCNACFALGVNEAEVENRLNAQAGDAVVVELRARGILRACLLAYGVPLLALLAGVALGSIWGDLFSALAALLFAAGAFVLLRALEPRFSCMRGFKPHMVEILETTKMLKGENDDGETSHKS